VKSARSPKLAKELIVGFMERTKSYDKKLGCGLAVRQGEVIRSRNRMHARLSCKDEVMA
jgi:hypothetical protein